MKNILRQIADILYEVPLMDKATMMGIMNPIKTEEQAKKMLDFLQKNQNNKEIMDTDYLIPNRKKIIGVEGN